MNEYWRVRYKINTIERVYRDGILRGYIERVYHERVYRQRISTDYVEGVYDTGTCRERASLCLCKVSIRV